MKFLYAVLFLVLAGVFSCGALGGCGLSTAEISDSADSAFVITNDLGSVAAFAPIVNYSVPDKLRNKRRQARIDSALCTSLVLCALSTVLSGLFYSKFCDAVSRMRGFDFSRRRVLPLPILFADQPVGAVLLI